MTCSAPPSPPDGQTAALARQAGELLGCAVPAASLRRVAGGGNNRLYRLDGPDGPLALKWYGERTAADAAGRLQREFEGLRFLAGAGIASVPVAVASDAGAHLALYGWLDGEPVDRAAAGRRGDDMAAALAFIGRLRAAAALLGAQDLLPATEACLSADDLLGQIGTRLGRLTELSGEADLHALLDGRLAPVLDAARARLRGLYASAGLDPARPLPPAARTLSPSDFGFHNALRRPDGTLVFVDFEYFGWDDPVKLTADLLWHPGLELSAAERVAWIAGTAGLFGADSSYGVRLAAQLPLYGLRWALIILNEFLPERWERRLFAAASAGAARDGWAAAKRTQLAKAAAWTDLAARLAAGAEPEPALFSRLHFLLSEVWQVPWTRDPNI